MIWMYCVLMTINLFSQSSKDTLSPKTHLGFSIGIATQSAFPFNDPNYSYKTQSFKFQYRQLILRKNNFYLEFVLEPGMYIAQHQLLHEEYISTTEMNYLEQRARFTQKRTFTEFAVSTGFLARIQLSQRFGSYIAGSIGPMISTTDTERLKKGFAFTSIAGLGVYHNVGALIIDLSMTLRHNSNANLASPNAGHNSAGIEFGVSFPLKNNERP